VPFLKDDEVDLCNTFTDGKKEFRLEFRKEIATDLPGLFSNTPFKS
jgi:hypothetical protein